MKPIHYWMHNIWIFLFLFLTIKMHLHLALGHFEYHQLSYSIIFLKTFIGQNKTSLCFYLLQWNLGGILRALPQHKGMWLVGHQVVVEHCTDHASFIHQPKDRKMNNNLPSCTKLILWKMYIWKKIYWKKFKKSNFFDNIR